MELPFINLGNFLLSQADQMWTFQLMIVRYIALFTILPGLNGGPQGRMVRYAGLMSMAYVAYLGSPIAVLPDNFGTLLYMVVNEVAFGAMLALIPFFLVSAVQMAGSLSSVTMGLGAGQLLDPTSGTSVTAVARLFGDIVILLFLLFDGHHVILYAASGLGGTIEPGTFFLGQTSVELIMDRFSDIFRLGAMVASPVIVALLLTNFILGLITKAIPQVNVFIVSFPLTIGIGLIISALSLPEIVVLMEREISGMENSVIDIIQDTKRIPG